MKIILLIALSALTAACESDYERQINQANVEANVRAIKRHEDEAEHSGQNCLDRKGIIVRSSWDGRIVDCK